MFGQDMTHIEEMIAKSSGQFASKASITTSTGYVAYDLELLLKQVYPVDAIFRNKFLPRKVSNRGGVSFNAKLMTNPGRVSGSFGVMEGKRGRDINPNEQDVTVYYRTVGQDGSTTIESEDAGESFDDVRSIMMTSLLNSNLMQEEIVALFGNGGNIARLGSSQQTALGTCNTPVLTNNGGGAGTVAAATYYCYCVALTYQGLQNSTVADGVPGQISVTTNGSGTAQTINGGNSIVSAASNSVTLASAGSLAGTVPYVRGAFGYAWFVGTSKAAAYLAAITTTNSFTLTAPPAGTQTASDAKVASDYSIDQYVYDGLITQVQQANSGAYVKSLNGANLTGNGAAGITEVDVALKAMFDANRIGPQAIMCDSGSKAYIDARVIAGGGTPLFRFNSDADGGRGIVANDTVKTYYNKWTGELIPVIVNPIFPQGTIFGFCTKLNLQTPNVPVPFRLQARSRDWTEYEWPMVERTRGRGQYVSAGLISYTPWTNFLLQNVGQG